jgi:outer membrane receptor protein involved in Fe transport
MGISMRATGMEKLNAMAIAVALAMSTVCISQGVQAQTQTAEVRSYDIPAGKLSESLKQFGTQSRLQLLAPPELTRGLDGNPVSGAYTARQALDHLLANSGLSYEFVNATTVVIKKGPGSVPDKTRSPNSSAGNAKEETHSAPTVLDAVTVTGTRIRGGVSPSETITISDAQMKEEGFNDLGEVIRSIPQNFRGGQNPGVVSAGGDITNENVTGGSALNLRGLGPDATLTLLNGRRMSYEGVTQAVDIGAIPMEAVERIEIVPDGASAIYGSDAVAGVANVVLKRDFDGITAGSRYGTTEDGGLTTHEYDVTAGATWSSGGLIGTFKTENQDPIYADQRSYTQPMNDPMAIYPGSKLRSSVVSVHQAIGDHVELRLDALHTVRNMLQETAYPPPPSYVLYKRPTTVWLLAPSVLFSLPADWSLSVSFTGGEARSFNRIYIHSGGTDSPVGNICYCDKSRGAEISAEGPLFHLGQNEARLATGAGMRMSELWVQGSMPSVHDGGKETSRYVYGELAVPLLSPEQGRFGLHRLELSLAARAEDYDSFGKVTTPKLGIIYAPSSDYTVKASWGRSFKAPTLRQQTTSRTVTLYSAQQLGGVAFPSDSTALLSFGGSPNLKPERARTSSLTVAFHPEAVPGLETELSYFDVFYTNRVAAPIVSSSQALNNPVYAPFIVYSPTLIEQNNLISQSIFQNFSGFVYDPSKVVAIAHNEYFNVGKQQVKGLDLNGSYRMDLGAGELQLRGSASWLQSSQQNGPGQPEFALSGMIYYPAKWNGRLGAVWQNGGFSASAFANHTSGVVRTGLVTQHIASFTTFDATLRYETAPGQGALSGFEIALSAQNLFNRAPPLYTPSSQTGIPYDSTNYSAIGRYLSLSVAKHW